MDMKYLTDCRLVIDFGNTLTKAAVFQNNRMLELITSNLLTIEQLKHLKHQYNPMHAIVSTVIDLEKKMLHYFSTHFNLILLDHHTPVPITNLYKTPETLGNDRLAMVVAAGWIFPATDCLAIGTGTCITYNFMDSSGNFHGGAISPGIMMRLRALHNFTDKLPLVSIKNETGLIGTNTGDSILSGVINGAISEMDGIIDRFKEQYEGLKVIITGGDLKYFTKRPKNPIFAVENLVLTGLNVILKFNVDN
jgi:type III pantothenate kinase